MMLNIFDMLFWYCVLSNFDFLFDFGGTGRMLLVFRRFVLLVFIYISVYVPKSKSPYSRPARLYLVNEAGSE